MKEGSQDVPTRLAAEAAVREPANCSACNKVRRHPKWSFPPEVGGEPKATNRYIVHWRVTRPRRERKALSTDYFLSSPHGPTNYYSYFGGRQFGVRVFLLCYFLIRGPAILLSHTYMCGLCRCERYQYLVDSDHVCVLY